MTAWAGRRLHFVGIGGCGMSGLALAADSLGATVTGSDRAETVYLQRLRDRGLKVTIGHASSSVPSGAELVYSSAVPADNPERGTAREQQLNEIPRGRLLAELARTRRCIAVAGTHGKTTTAAMIVAALSGSGHSVDYIVGGDLLSTGTNARWNGGNWAVIETDESDRSLLELTPEIAVLTNAEYEHVQTFASLEEVTSVFQTFLAGCRNIVVWDRPELTRLCTGEFATFDVAAPRFTPAGASFNWRGRTVNLRVLGEHNALNAAAALEVCQCVGADPAASVRALEAFPGVARRLQRIGYTSRGAELYDDYAHHPSAVRAALLAAKTLAPDRIVAIFKPWGLARARALCDAFGAALGGADLSVVLDVANGDGGEHARAADRIASAARAATPGLSVRRAVDGPAAADCVRDELTPGTLCLTFCCADAAERLVINP
jgi:UDP-N-acetylmuramate--alanine ligase